MNHVQHVRPAVGARAVLLACVAALAFSCSDMVAILNEADGFARWSDIPSFPGAQGFGARASGGRGGKVVYVTNLNPSGPGSLNAALGLRADPAMSVPRYILFKVSGVVQSGTSWDEATHYEYGQFTLAGQTSPGGIIVQGIIASHSGSADKPDSRFDNVIIRHLRSRPNFYQLDKAPWSADAPAGHVNRGRDDAIRLQGAQYVMIDHCSFARAQDECMQIAENRWFSVQNSIFAETLGEHFDRGGILVKYGSAERPNTDISFHHNLVSRIGGRMPQFSFCDAAMDPNNRKPCPNCAGYCERTWLNFELSCNLAWDPGAAYYFDNNSGFSHYRVNMVNNYHAGRGFTLPKGSASFPMYPYSQFTGFSYAESELYANGNRLSLHPTLSDYQLFGGFNDFYTTKKTSEFKPVKLTSRAPFPTVDYTPADQLTAYLSAKAGAFPRDPMDRRLVGYLQSGTIAPVALDRAPADDAHRFDWSTAPAPPLDSDDDGMPDSWEVHNGLDPLKQDHTGRSLSLLYTGIEGYDNLEVYLNRLSEHLVDGRALTEGLPRAMADQLSVSLEPAAALPGQRVRLTVHASADLRRVALGLAQIEAPCVSPAPAPAELGALHSGAAATYDILVPADRAPGRYDILVRAEAADGTVSDRIVVLAVR